MKAFRPMMFFAAILVFIGLACNAGSGGDTPNQPVATAVQVQPTVSNPPTSTPEPTDVPATEPPTEEVAPTESAPEALDFFTEEFEDTYDPANWSTFTVTGSNEADPDKVTIEPENGKLVWNFDSERVYYYLFYNPYEYDNVKVELRADNRGRNNNSISLICRYEENVGWYEFNIANNGLYDILYADVSDINNIVYETIANGGSNSIKQGKEVNEYGITCNEDKLTLTINGKETTSIVEKRFGLRSGLVGVSVSSFDVLPIVIEMDWLKISQP